MSQNRKKLLTTTAALPIILGLAVAVPAAIGASVIDAKPAIAACNPCSAKKAGCGAANPCAAKKAACNPCAAKKAGCGAANPCAAKKAACSPCAAKKN